MSRIVINGKFLGSALNGVHRTAAEYAFELIRRMGQDHEIRLVAPRETEPHPDFPQLRPEVHPGRFGSGQGWEMLTLPGLARNALLVNFCNLGPLLHSNSLVMIHDAQTFLYPADYSGRQATAYRALLPWIARRSRRVLTVSDFSRHSLAGHGVGHAGKIDVVHNGTDHILRTPAEPGILNRHGVAPKSYVMVVGSAKGYKNIRRVFEAMSPQPPGGLRLVVAGGPGPERYLKAGWQPPHGTVFTGFVTDGELRALYENACLFAFPSQTEGFGLPPVEAMHCGTPVIAASSGAMPEVCDDGALLIDPEDTEAWRAAITHLAQDGQAARDLASRGSARAAKLTWNIAGQRLCDVLRPLL